MKRLCPLVLLILSSCTFQQRNDSVPSAKLGPSSKIIGGIEVAKGSWQASTSLMISTENSQHEPALCTGTLIAEDLVLTAAHCVATNLELMNLIFNVDPFAEDGLVTRSVTHSWIHPDALLDPKDRRDLALLQFSGGLPPGARLAHLAEAGSIPRTAAMTFQALGYGRTSGLSSDATDLMGAGRLRLVALQTQNLDGHRAEFTISQDQGKGVCYGDSGGAAYSVLSAHEAIVIGVASGVFNVDRDQLEQNGDDCAQRAVYMNVAYYRPWILSTIERAHAITAPDVLSKPLLERNSTLSTPVP